MTTTSALRRHGVWIALALFVALRVEAQPPSVVAQRAFQVTYLARLQRLPTTATRVEVWVPLATSRDGQRVVHRAIQMAVPYEIATEPVYGNDILHVTLTAPFPETLEVQVDYEAVVSGGDRITAAPAAVPPLSPEMQATYLRAEQLTVIDEPVRRMAAEAVQGRTTTLARARGIYDAVIRHMRYDNDLPGWGRGDVVRACAIGRGNCTDFHSLCIAMMRAAGIPARFKIGAAIPADPAGPILGAHCWAEFYLPERGWIPVDASEAWKHPDLREHYFGTADPNKFTISLGRDLRLMPAQQGGPVNIFIKPYVEVDGQPFDDVQLQFLMRNGQPREGVT